MQDSVDRVNRVDRIVNLGFNCSSTLVVTHFLEYKGHGPLDWGYSSPTTVCKFLAHLFISGVDKTAEKFSVKTEGSTGPTGPTGPWIPEFDYNYVHQGKFNADQIKRRVQRFHDALIDKNTFILFTFVNHDQDEPLPTHTVPPLLIKASRLIRLFRPAGTYRIAFLHAMTYTCDTTGFEEHDIDRIEVPHVSEPRYWIWPCVQRLKNKYPLTEIESGRFRIM